MEKDKIVQEMSQTIRNMVHIDNTPKIDLTKSIEGLTKVSQEQKSNGSEYNDE